MFSSAKNTNINYTNKTKKELFIDIIDRILKSIYVKNFYRTKDQLINKKKLTITNKQFIDQVKNDENIFNVDDIINYKSKIEKNINHKLKSNQNYISRFVYRHLNENEGKIPSDVIINVINKAFNGIHSYYALKQKGIKCNKPKYLRKNGLYNLLFFDRSRKEIDNSTIRLTVGKHIANKYIEITKNSSLICLNKQENTCYKKYINKSIMKKIIKKQPKSKNYILNDKYIEKNNKNILNGYYISIPKPAKIKNLKIKMVEITPVYDGHTFKINYIYEKPHNDLDNNVKDKLKNYLSIDLGMKNLMTMYDPRGINKIISGSYINSLNYYYNHKINHLKSRLKKCQNKNTSKRIRNLLINRFNKIDCYFNKLVKWFVDNYSQTKKKIIIGYNTNWKKGVNMGKENNRKFYQVPFCRLLNKLKNKMSEYGTELIFTEESYTSKCDALSLEEICKHDEYNGKRIKRGLFSSSVGKLINSDINGAINIMRKYLNKIGGDLKKIKYKYICNPQKINIFSEAQ